MEAVRNFRLGRSAFSIKVLVTCVVATLAVGYGVSLLQVHNRGAFDRERTILHFRGAETEENGLNGIYVRQSDTTMISVAHVHTFSQPVTLGIMGLLFALTGLAEGTKVLWILLSFLGSLAMNAGPWLIRDVSLRFVILLYAAGVIMILSFLVMAAAVLYETWWKKETP